MKNRWKKRKKERKEQKHKKFEEFNITMQVFNITQFSSVTQSCLTICDPVNHSTPGLPVHYQLPESTQTHVHWVSDANQLSYPLSSPFPPALNLSQHQSLFKWVGFLHQVAKVLEFQRQHQSFQWTSRADLLYDGLVGVGSREELSQVQGKEQCCALLEQPWRDTPCPR